MESDSAQPQSVPMENQVNVVDPVFKQQPPPLGGDKGGTVEGEESAMKEGVSVMAGPETMQKLAMTTSPTDEKKFPVVGGAVDDGAYENLKTQSLRSMNKVLQEEQSADEFFKVPTEKKDGPVQMSSPPS